MKSLIFAGIFGLVTGAAPAQDAPPFFADTYPQHALGEMLQWYGTLGGEEAALDESTRELIALGVAAQVPCGYCVYAHTQNARAAGASDAEIREAVAIAGAVRHNSTVLNGMSYDLEQFKAEHDRLRATASAE